MEEIEKNIKELKMVIGLIGESCTGKTTIIKELEKQLEFKVYTGKDYLKLDKNPINAKNMFKCMLEESKGELIIYVITEKEHLELLPKNALRVLVTAELDLIKERFSKRMQNNLPKPVEMMIERKHGMFDDIEYDLCLAHEDVFIQVKKITEYLKKKTVESLSE